MWISTRSDYFIISNCGKWGGVITPLLFRQYVGKLYLKLKHLELGYKKGHSTIDLRIYVREESTGYTIENVIPPYLSPCL